MILQIDPSIFDYKCDNDAGRTHFTFLTLSHLLRFMDLATPVFVALRKKRNQYSLIHIYLSISNLIIANNLNGEPAVWFHAFSNLYAVAKYVYYFLFHFSYRFRLYRALKSLVGIIRYFHLILMILTLLMSFCSEDAIMIHSINILAVIIIKKITG
jgi:hypothetical protein